MRITTGSLLLVTCLALSACAPTPASEPGVAPGRALSVTVPTARAAPGDTVLVLVNRIKADKREQFESFVNSFWASGMRLGKTDPTIGRVFQHTRVLNPVRPNADGTYSYIFIMDPVIPGGNYDIEATLKRMYPADEAARRFKMLEETFAGEQSGWTVVQFR